MHLSVLVRLRLHLEQTQDCETVSQLPFPVDAILIHIVPSCGHASCENRTSKDDVEDKSNNHRSVFILESTVKKGVNLRSPFECIRKDEWESGHAACVCQSELS